MVVTNYMKKDLKMSTSIEQKIKSCIEEFFVHKHESYWCKQYTEFIIYSWYGKFHAQRTVFKIIICKKMHTIWM